MGSCFNEWVSCPGLSNLIRSDLTYLMFVDHVEIGKHSSQSLFTVPRLMLKCLGKHLAATFWSSQLESKQIAAITQPKGYAIKISKISESYQFCFNYSEQLWISFRLLQALMDITDLTEEKNGICFAEWIPW